MHRGISPIVAVVLLIAIAVVSAVGLYFWAGGISTKQPTTNVPIAISATPIDAANGKIAVANLGYAPLTLSFLRTADGRYCNFTTEVTIPPNEQEVCTMAPKRGETILYGPNIGQAVVILPPGEISEVTFQGNGFSPISLTITDFSGGSFGENATNGSVALVGETPSFSGSSSRFNYDLANTGEYPYSGPTTNNRLWSFSGADQVTSSAVVFDDVVYFGSVDHNVYAVHARNGTKIWNRTLGDWIHLSTPAIDNGLLYVGSYDQSLYALDLDDGSVAWSRPLGDGIAASPLVYDGKIHISSNTGHMYMVNATDGTIIHDQLFCGGSTLSSASVYDGKLYVTSPCNFIYALNISDYSVIWQNSTTANVVFTPAVSEGRVFIGETGGGTHFYALNASTGYQLWNYTVGGPVGSYASAAVSGGLVYFGSEDNNLYALHVEDGSLAWSHALGEDVRSPTVANGVVYATTNSVYFYALNAQTGSELWHAAGGNANLGSRASAVVVGDVIYIGGDGSGLYAIGGHKSPGYYYSELMNSTDDGMNWTRLSWDATTPANTQLTFWANVTNTTGAGSWSHVDNGGALGVGKYLRLKAELNTSDGIYSPTLSRTIATYMNVNGNLTYTVNSATALSWVAINRTCGAVNSTVVNATGLSGYFYTNTITNRTDCDYLVWGPGFTPQQHMVEEIE